MRKNFLRLLCIFISFMLTGCAQLPQNNKATKTICANYNTNQSNNTSFFMFRKNMDKDIVNKKAQKIIENYFEFDFPQKVNLLFNKTRFYNLVKNLKEDYEVPEIAFKNLQLYIKKFLFKKLLTKLKEIGVFTYYNENIEEEILRRITADIKIMNISLQNVTTVGGILIGLYWSGGPIGGFIGLGLGYICGSLYSGYKFKSKTMEAAELLRQKFIANTFYYKKVFMNKLLK